MPPVLKTIFIFQSWTPNLGNREDCFADLLKAAKYAPNPYLQGKVISQVLSKPWPVVSAIIHPQSFLANFVLLLPIYKVSHYRVFRIPNLSVPAMTKKKSII